MPIKNIFSARLAVVLGILCCSAKLSSCFNSMPIVANNWNKANVAAFRTLRSFGNAVRPHPLTLSSTVQEQGSPGQGEWDDWDRDIDFDDEFGDEETELTESKHQNSAVQSFPQRINSNVNENPGNLWNEDAPYFEEDSLEEHTHLMEKAVSQRIESYKILATASVDEAKSEDSGVGSNKNQSDVCRSNQPSPWRNQRVLDAVQFITSILQLVVIILIAQNQWKLMKVISDAIERNDRILSTK